MISSALLKLLSSGTISAFRKFGKTADCNKSLSCTDSCTFISYCFCRSLVVVLLQISVFSCQSQVSRELFYSQEVKMKVT